MIGQCSDSLRDLGDMCGSNVHEQKESMEALQNEVTSLRNDYYANKQVITWFS